MKPADRDAAYLWDMRDAALCVHRLIDGMDFDGFQADERTSLAIERLLQNIGEAASHVSAAGRARHPQVPWKEIIGMRNVLAHQYGAIDARRVWMSASVGVPQLLAFLPEEV